ncbi:hypothetical protein C8Q77DRAFT_1155387 [Trametes polyzona]|nr:hypothetical protein C8Q77DRAFT_1155387 [Trametes polyzona]
MSTYLQRLDTLSTLVDRISASGRVKHSVFVDLLKSGTTVVRDAEIAGAPELPHVVDKAGDLFDEAIKWAYTDGDFNFLPSYAHALDNAPVEDTLSVEASGMRNFLSGFMANFEKQFLGSASGEPCRLPDTQLTKSWTSSPHPHPKTSRLSRFREGVSASATDTTPVAQMIYQARCEVASDTISSPIDAAIAGDSSVLAIIGQGGWKNREPSLTVYFLDEQVGDEKEDSALDITSYGGFRYMSLEPGLSDVARFVATDDVHKLFLVADSHRVKRFSWSRDVAFGDWTPAPGKNVHTLRSEGYTGPVAGLPSGRIARAGKGGVAIWDVNTLETHKGGRRVGRGEISTDDSWRENDGDIELSTGSPFTTTVAFAQSALQPAAWQFHAPTGHMLCGESGHVSKRFGCYAVDLEHGGATAARFLGHGGNVTAFSTSAGDPNVFATACGDGYARLFDVRHPLPVLTLDAGKSSEFCLAVQLIHPDGIPTVFTGGDRSECVKMWDVRARALVYELATGNTAVRALAWDARRTTLYAATECEYIDRLGYTHGYRSAHIPRWGQLDPPAGQEGAEGGDEDDYDSDEDDNGGDERCWPERAAHEERFFGYAYDAGEHTLLRYKYKEDPDSSVLPDYGQAQMGGGFW